MRQGRTRGQATGRRGRGGRREANESGAAGCADPARAGAQRAGAPRPPGGGVTSKPGNEASNDLWTGARSSTGGSRSARPAPSGARSRASPTRASSSTFTSASSGEGSQCRYAQEENNAPSPRPPLRQSHHLCPTMEDLPRPPAGEAHEVAEVARHRAAAVDLEASLPSAGQRVHPPRPDPLGGDGHIGQPQRVVPRDPDVEPELLARPQIHGPSPAPPALQLHLALPEGGDVDQFRRLGAAQHTCRPCDLAGDRQPRWLVPELLDVEEGGRGQPTLRRPWRDTAPTAGPHPTGAATARGARPVEPA